MFSEQYCIAKSINNWALWLKKFPFFHTIPILTSIGGSRGIPLYCLKFIENGSCGCFLFSDMLPHFKQYKGIPLEPPIDVNIGIVWKKGNFLSHSAQLFIDFAIQYCSENITT
jgi:hypothetical protein